MPCLSNSIEHAHFAFCDHTARKIKMVDLLVSSYQCKGARTSMEDFFAVYNGGSGHKNPPILS